MALQVGELITAVIGSVIGIALLPVLTSAIDSAKGNVSGIGSTLLDIVPIIYIIVIVSAMAFYVYAKGKGR